jgi:integrase
MASIWKREKSKFWTACFTDKSGRQLKRSTKETDRRKALAIANDYERVARERMTRTKIQDVISDLFRRTNLVTLESTSATDFYGRWIARKRLETAKSTIAKYEQVVGREFLSSLGGLADDGMQFISREDVARFRDSYAGRLSTATVNINLKCVRAFFQDAWRADIVPENVAAKVPVLKKDDDESVRRPFTPDELKRIIAAAGSSEWRGLILFGLYTGQRLGDIASLRWNSLHNLHSAPELKFRTQKTKKLISVPVARPLLEYLTKELQPGDKPDSPLFPESHEVITGQKRAAVLSNGFHDVLVAAGLAGVRSRANTGKGRSNRRITSELSFHSLRHTATSLLKEAGVSQSAAMAIVGHDSPAISANYTHVGAAEMAKALATLPDLVNVNKSKRRAK